MFQNTGFFYTIQIVTIFTDVEKNMATVSEDPPERRRRERWSWYPPFHGKVGGDVRYDQV